MVLGVAMLVAGALDCTDGAEVAGRLLALGAVAIALGLGLRLRTERPEAVGPTAVLAAMLLAFLVAVAWSVVVYLSTGTITGGADAAFESVSGYSTTALTVLDDPQQLPRGVLAWRSVTQWLGGLGAVVALVGLLPELGLGAPEPGRSRSHEHPWRRSNRHLARLLRRLAVVYSLLTVVGVLMLAVAGLGPYDALSVSLTTVSTGGFSDHPESIAHFESAAVEWVVLAGMAVSGASLALLWRGLTGAIGGFLRSAELRAYVVILAGAGAIVVVGTTADSGLTHAGIRDALFSVTSALSTTGHTVTDWTNWSFGPQAVLVVLMAVGSMSASAGGGFSVLRAVTMTSIVRREVLRELDSHRVVAVKVGKQPIGEGIVDRMVGFQILSVLLVTAGAVALAVTGVDLVGAGSGSVAALSTVGPALGDLGPGERAVTGSIAPQLVLMLLMTAGRLEIYPVARAVAAVGARVHDVVGRLRQPSW